MLLDELLGSELLKLLHRSAVPSKFSLFEFYRLQPRLTGLLLARTPAECKDKALPTAVRSLLNSIATASPFWPLAAGAKGWSSLQHGDLQTAHVLLDTRQHHWLLRCSHSAGPGHVLQDAAKLCASTLFLGTALPLSRADLYSPPPRELSAQLGISQAEAQALQQLLARTTSLDSLRHAIATSSLSVATQQRVLLRIGTDDERCESLRQAQPKPDQQ